MRWWAWCCCVPGTGSAPAGTHAHGACTPACLPAPVCAPPLSQRSSSSSGTPGRVRGPPAAPSSSFGTFGSRSRTHARTLNSSCAHTTALGHLQHRPPSLTNPKHTPPPPPAPQNLHPNIITDIRLHKYDVPTPIQAQGIPIALSGFDILGCAETGSGKTASFAIPMIHHCLAQPPLRPGDGPIGLVLAPTRELAQQVCVGGVCGWWCSVCGGAVDGWEP